MVNKQKANPAHNYPRVSGGLDLETADNGAGQWDSEALTVPWIRGWNIRADERSSDTSTKLNMYAVNSLVRNSWNGGWSGTSSNEWSARGFWRSLWGKSNVEFEEDYSVSQNYANVRPPYYVSFNNLAKSNGVDPVFHSGVAWDCEKTPTWAAQEGNDPAKFYVDSLESWRDFTTVVGQAARPPYYRIKVNMLDYTACSPA